jgi:hypothetical protein
MKASDFIIASTSTLYNIVNSASEFVIDVVGQSLQLDPSNKGNSQNWQLVHFGYNTFFVVNSSNQQYLALDENGQLTITDFTGSISQTWQIMDPGTNDGSYFLYNSFYSVYLTGSNNVLQLDKINVPDSNHLWSFNALDSTTTLPFNQNDFLSEFSFYVTNATGEYLALGNLLNVNIYSLTSLTAVDNALLFTIDKNGIISTVTNNQTYYLTNYNGEPALDTAQSSLSASLMLFNDELTYIRFQDESYLALNPDSSQEGLIFHHNQFFQGAAFNIIPTAILPGADMSRFRIPTEFLNIRAEKQTLDPCTMAWVNLIFHSTVGLISAVGLVPAIVNGQVEDGFYAMIGGNATALAAANTLVTFIQSNPKFSAAVFIAVTEFLHQLYDCGLLMKFITEVIYPMLGWLGFAWALKKIILWLFAPSAELVNLLVGVGVWGYKLIVFALDIPVVCQTENGLRMPKLQLGLS